MHYVYGTDNEAITMSHDVLRNRKVILVIPVPLIPSDL